MRVSGPLFVAFCLARENGSGPRIGFTAPRALGGAVIRNRLKRRLREAIRLRIPAIGPKWDIVFNPRKPLLEAPWDTVRQEVDRVVAKCAAL